MTIHYCEVERLESPFPIHDVISDGEYYFFFERYSTWKYNGVPIFLKKINERLNYRVCYGGEVYDLPSLYRAMAVIDTLTSIRAWQVKLPNTKRYMCPHCQSFLTRDAFFTHYIENHIQDVEKTEVVLAQVRTDLYPFFEKYNISNVLGDDFLLDKGLAA